jgi:hypothetical protein
MSGYFSTTGPGSSGNTARNRSKVTTLNACGIQGLVEATLIAAVITVPEDRIQIKSEGDACNVHFKDFQRS